MASKKINNPFYFLLVIVGCAFALTACAYFVMTTMARDATTWQEVDSGGPLMAWMDQYGFTLMVVELALLAVFTFAAIATDEYWTKKGVTDRRADAEQSAPEAEDSTEA
ncbi:MAG TPA: hypothetical protein DCY79_19260 [Planctomycetaceae bacterium]|nr:hypothetical protein [Blastopirellula sp.]HAY81947.1 hypothetical protein [Planctomycetaceae bacterium]|tara:strand:- start:649 stop:975 length:327 start_codon:yes stop_codon:yes gene_type:complete